MDVDLLIWTWYFRGEVVGSAVSSTFKQQQLRTLFSLSRKAGIYYIWNLWWHCVRTICRNHCHAAIHSKFSTFLLRYLTEAFRVEILCSIIKRPGRTRSRCTQWGQCCEPISFPVLSRLLWLPSLLTQAGLITSPQRWIQVTTRPSGKCAGFEHDRKWHWKSLCFVFLFLFFEVIYRHFKWKLNAVPAVQPSLWF